MLGIGSAIENCTTDQSLVDASRATNVIEVMFQILAKNHGVHPCEAVRFETNNPLPSSVCIPRTSASLSELDRLLHPYCECFDQFY